VSWGPAIEQGQELTAFHIVVIRNGQMTAWQQAGPTQRQVVVPIGATGPVDVYVFAQSSGGFGLLGSPIHVR
jgi:hypothetical protein